MFYINKFIKEYSDYKSDIINFCEYIEVKCRQAMDLLLSICNSSRLELVAITGAISI